MGVKVSVDGLGPGTLGKPGFRAVRCREAVGVRDFIMDYVFWISLLFYVSVADSVQRLEKWEC